MQVSGVSFFSVLLLTVFINRGAINMILCCFRGVKLNEIRSKRAGQGQHLTLNCQPHFTSRKTLGSEDEKSK